jgi:hypothetical protein
VGSKYSRRDRSFILGNRILRSVRDSESINFHMILSRLQFIAGPLATWLVASIATTIIQGQLTAYSWEPPIILAAFSLSIAVNTLVTGLIVFRILKVFLEVKAATTSVERTLGTTWTGTKLLRNVVFMIIESGMALLFVQLVRVTLYILQIQLDGDASDSATNGYVILIVINEMFNVISIRSVCPLLLFLLITFYYLDRASHRQ